MGHVFDLPNVEFKVSCINTVHSRKPVTLVDSVHYLRPVEYLFENLPANE